MSRDRLSGHYVGTPGQRLFVLLREPRGGAARASVLLVPPFGEEMNKSRRMMAETAQRLAGAGRAVVMPDLFGTGDSEGEFRDATVERWVDDLGVAARFAATRGTPVSAVLAVRLGCALAVAAQRCGALPSVGTTVWWQPVLDGGRYLKQCLRLRVAAGGMRGEATETVEGLRERSGAGETIAVAGYEFSPALVRGLEALSVDGWAAQAGTLHWFEFVRGADVAPPLPVTRFMERARSAGVGVNLETIAAEPFWVSTETVRLPDVADTTAAVLDAGVVAALPRPAGDSQVNA